MISIPAVTQANFRISCDFKMAGPSTELIAVLRDLHMWLSRVNALGIARVTISWCLSFLFFLYSFSITLFLPSRAWSNSDAKLALRSCYSVTIWSSSSRAELTTMGDLFYVIQQTELPALIVFRHCSENRIIMITFYTYRNHSDHAGCCFRKHIAILRTQKNQRNLR